MSIQPEKQPGARYHVAAPGQDTSPMHHPKKRPMPRAHADAIACEIVAQVGQMQEFVHGRRCSASQSALIADALRRLLYVTSADPATRARAARHEASHFVVGAVFGLKPIEASIWRISRPIGPSAWGGGCEFQGGLDYSPNNSFDVARYALTVLAGPAAEGGHTLTGLGDWLQAIALVKGLSQRTGWALDAFWRDTMREAVAATEFYRDLIAAVASVLEMHGRASCLDPHVANILALARARCRFNKPLSPEGEALAVRITEHLSAFLI